MSAGRSKVPNIHSSVDLGEPSLVTAPLQPNLVSEQITSWQRLFKFNFFFFSLIKPYKFIVVIVHLIVFPLCRASSESQHISHVNESPITSVSSDKACY